MLFVFQPVPNFKKRILHCLPVKLGGSHSHNHLFHVQADIVFLEYVTRYIYIYINNIKISMIMLQLTELIMTVNTRSPPVQLSKATKGHLPSLNMLFQATYKKHSFTKFIENCSKRGKKC